MPDANQFDNVTLKRELRTLVSRKGFKIYFLH